MSKRRTLPPEENASRTSRAAAQRVAPLAYRVGDAAAAIGVSGSKVRALIREGRLPARHLDGSTIIRHKDLVAFVDGLPLVRQLAEPFEQPASAPPPLVPRSAPPPPASTRRPRAPPPAVATARPAISPPIVPTATYLRGPLSPDKILRTPTPQLAAVIGSGPMRRPEALAKLWDYIRAHDLQAEVDRRVILADPNLKAAFGLERISMHDLNRLVKARLTPGWDTL